MSDYDGLLRAAEETVCLPAGTLTAAGFEKALDEMWNAGRRHPGFDYDSPARRFELPGVYFCDAVLFPLPPRPPLPVEPVHPLLAVYWGPQQGPRPLVCDREPHPESPWHWADRTWWR